MCVRVHVCRGGGGFLVSMPGSEKSSSLHWAARHGPGVNSDDRMHFATSCPERFNSLSLRQTLGPSQALMDGPHTGCHTSPSSPEAVTQVIGVISVDCMPNADKTVRNRELCALPLIVWVKALTQHGPQLSGGTPGRGSGPSCTS